MRDFASVVLPLKGALFSFVCFHYRDIRSVVTVSLGIFGMEYLSFMRY